MRRDRYRSLRVAAKVLGVVVAGLLAGAALGIVAGAVLSEDRRSVVAERSVRDPRVTPSPEATSTSASDAAASIPVPGIPGGTVRVLFAGRVPEPVQRRVLRALDAGRDPLALTRRADDPLPRSADVTVLGHGLASDAAAAAPGAVLCLGSRACRGGTAVGDARDLAARLAF